MVFVSGKKCFFWGGGVREEEKTSPFFCPKKQKIKNEKDQHERKPSDRLLVDVMATRKVLPGN